MELEARARNATKDSDVDADAPVSVTAKSADKSADDPYDESPYVDETPNLAREEVARLESSLLPYMDI